MKIEITSMALHHHETGCRCELTHRDTVGVQRVTCDGGSPNEAIGGAFSKLMQGRLQPVRVGVFDDSGEWTASRTFFVETGADIEVRVSDGIPTVTAEKVKWLESGGRE